MWKWELRKCGNEETTVLSVYYKCLTFSAWYFSACKLSYRWQFHVFTLILHRIIDIYFRYRTYDRMAGSTARLGTNDLAAWWCEGPKRLGLVV